MRNAGMVFDIQRLSLHNGDGLRTSIFLKGCPLRCLWCHNPESQRMAPEVFFKPEKCIGCGRCAEICACHHLEGGRHVIDRRRCQRCMRCPQDCPSGALEQTGQEMTVDEIVDVVLRDRVFFATSGGGVTLTGGEPMAQSGFAIALARACHEQGLNVCVDTSGYAPGDAFREMAQWADTFLFDIKETDPILHRQYTGVDMQLIHDNLRLLDGLGKQLRLRCPIIPGLNDREEHLRSIAALAESLQQTHPIDVIPYHPLGEKKLDWLDEDHPMQVQSFPEREEVDGWIACIAAHTRCPVQHA